MEIINYVQQPRKRSAVSFFKNTSGNVNIRRSSTKRQNYKHNYKNYRDTSKTLKINRDRSYQSSALFCTDVGITSFRAEKVRQNVSVRSIFSYIGQGVTESGRFLRRNVKVIAISILSLVLITAGVTALAIGFNYMENHTGPISINAEDSFDLDALDKLMSDFALEVADVDAEGNLIGEDISANLIIAQPVEYQTYKVKSGDTISGIAKKFGLKNISTLISVNDIGNVRQLGAGQKLKVPSMDGIIYTVKKGDSLNSLVSKYNVKLSTLLDVNELTSESLSAGQQLFIPGVGLDQKTLQNAMGELFIIPISAPFRWTSPYGWRADPFTGVRSFHTGTDMACPNGTPILAAMSGRIADVGYNRIYGNYIIINHGNGYQTLYAHQSKTIAKKGQWVSQGTRIGLVGSTGYSTGDHLHFMVYKNGTRIDPMTVLRK